MSTLSSSHTVKKKKSGANLKFNGNKLITFQLGNSNKYIKFYCCKKIQHHFFVQTKIIAINVSTLYFKVAQTSMTVLAPQKFNFCFFTVRFLSYIRIAGELESIAAEFAHEAVYSLDRSYTWAQRDPKTFYTHIHTCGKFWVFNGPNMPVFLYVGRSRTANST